MEDTPKDILSSVYSALKEKGYDPIAQIAGYLITEDPTYITNHKQARALIRKVDRDVLIRDLISTFLADEAES